MEGRGSEGVQLSSTNPAKPVGTLALRNFTIPRKKRASGQVLLEPCPEESRDYSLIQSKLREARLDVRKEHANTWLWKDVMLVHNEEFLKEFSEKRSEMRTKGRHGREMEERFCFLVASPETTTQIYQNGLRTETQQQYSLGKPSHGVYLFRHVDVALKHAATTSLNGKNLIVFKVLFGKVKKVTSTSDWNRTPDPMVAFDCHMSKDAVSHRESLPQQVLGSSVFLFDYNENHELNNRPRQCLPYAVVSFVPAISATPPTSISPPVSPVKHSSSLAHGPLEHLRGCTVAKRRGKGENATVTFKHFSTPTQTACPGPEHNSPTPGIESTPFQQNDQQNPLLFNPPQLYMPLFHTAGYFGPSLPYVDNSIPFQFYPDESAFPSNGQLLSTPNIYESNTDKGGIIPQSTSTEKISTIVYSSRLVKDPRLSRQGTNPEQKSSEQEKASSSSETDEQRCQPHSQDDEEKSTFPRTVSCDKQSLKTGEEQSQDCCLKPSQEPEPSPRPKTENMPSMKLFKMKFQKYAAYLKMTEDERHKNIWSQQGLTPEQKQSLIDRIHFYETYYQKYKQGLLFQKDTETENAASLSKMEPKNNKPCLSTPNKSLLITRDSKVNQSPMRHSEGSDVSTLKSTTDLGGTEGISKRDLIKDNDQVSHDDTESTTKEQDPPLGSSKYSAELQGNVVQSAVEPSISETSFDKDPLSLNTSENIEALERTTDSEQPSCPRCPSEQDNEANPQAVSKSQCSTTASQSTLTNNVEENPELEFHNTTATAVSNCDISVLDVSVKNDLPTATAMGSDQNSQSSTKNKDRGYQNYSEPDEGSEMSIEVKRGELRQDNTIHSALYKRLQLDQLLPNLCGTDAFPNKSYLRPKDLDTIPSINQLYGHLHETVPKEGFNEAKMKNWEYGEDLQLTFMKTFNQVSARTERLTLSERFSKLRSLRKKLTVFVHGRKTTKSDTVHLTRDGKSAPECRSLSRERDEGSGNDNVKLIQLFAQRFKETRPLASCRHLREKRSKVLSRRKTNSTVLSLKHLAQSRRALHIRKRHLRRKCKTKLDPNGISQGPVLCSKPPSNSSASQSPDPQSLDILCNNEPTQEDHLSAEDQSCEYTPTSDNKPSQDDEFRQITQSKETSTEVLSSGDIKKVQEDILLDAKGTAIIDEMEPQERGTNNSSICPREESFPITCCVSNNDGGIAKAVHMEEVTPQEPSFVHTTQEEKEKYGTKEISTDSSAGACKDKSTPAQAVSSIPSDTSSGNMISSCIAKTQAAMTPDLPRVMNNDNDMETETRTLHGSAVDSAGTGVIKSAVDIMANASTAGKTVEMDTNNKIVTSDLCDLENLTHARDKDFFLKDQTSDVNQNSSKTPKSGKDELSQSLDNIIHPTELASSSQQNTNNSSMINSHVKDAKEQGIVIPGSLHSAWQGQDNKNNVPSTSTETHLISKLRDYLTRFEISVKKQEPVNDPVKDGQVPMAWITLDSTVHKQQLFDTQHYNRLDFASLRHQAKDCSLDYMLPLRTNEQVTGKVINVTNEAANSPVAPTKRKLSKGRNQSKSYTPKRMRRSKLARVSPDSTSMLEKDTDRAQISTSVPNLQQLSQNHGNTVQQTQIIYSQGLENVNRPSAQRFQVNLLSENSLPDKKDTNPFILKEYSVTDISSTLKLADHAVCVAELSSLQLKCKSMLQYFISNFEQDQKVPFKQSCISRNLILEKYLDHPPEPVELKFEALNSFLELQMMVEAFQFVENKINFLSRKATFRSLLWYDPSLYGELYKGAVGFQQQSSLFSSFQQCLASEGYRKLHEYYTAVSTLHQQLQDAPDTSYYMYLKSKRERLEIEAALRNPPDIKSFFLSVPVALMMNFGDDLESVEKAHRIVMTFVETPSDRLPGMFDVGKAEHLSIICRYLQEKLIFLKSNDQISKVSWFGLEHLLYDASKLLVWRESEQGMSSEVLLKYKRSNPQIVYGVTETGVALVNKIEHPVQPVERARITPEQKMDGARNYRDTQSGISNEKTHSAQGIQTEDRIKESHQQARRRATHPPLRRNSNDGGLALLGQPNLPGQLGNPTPFSAFSPQGNAGHWRMAGQHAWDWNPPGVGQLSKSNPEIRALLLSKRRMTIPCTEPRTDIQKNPAGSQDQWPLPFIMNPRAVERINLQPTIGAPLHAELRKEHPSDATLPLMQPFPFPCLPPDTSSIVPPPVPHLSFSKTSNQLSPHEISMPINYPFFLFNGKTYSAVAPSVPVPGPTVHTETQYHPHPV
ncbi:uncharacterized protein tex15 [Salminus brasiliensis]|uniref:uncharacterized protein tex15 n=1 Tax=Salminus brasiliensis TaxID=930266 RepID=UPI003B835B71